MYKDSKDSDESRSVILRRVGRETAEVLIELTEKLADAVETETLTPNEAKRIFIGHELVKASLNIIRSTTGELMAQNPTEFKEVLK